MRKKRVVKTCRDCAHLCPFIDGSLGDCSIHFRETNKLVEVSLDGTCEHFKKV